MQISTCRHFREAAKSNNVNCQAFNTLMQSYIYCDVREERIHKSLSDPVKIPRISIIFKSSPPVSLMQIKGNDLPSFDTVDTYS